MNRVAARLACLFVVFAPTACTTAPERALSTDVSRFVTLPSGGEPRNPTKLSAVAEDAKAAARQSTKRRAGEPLQVLELTGGGQNGAFGVGVLGGWEDSGRPLDFDFVTGVSTGTLMATYAFLGTPEDIRTISDAYLGITKDDIYTKHGIAHLLGGGSSLYSTEPFQALLEKLVTQDLLDRVAREYDKGRRLLCSTTNLDYKQTWVWDLSAIAKHGGPGALDLYRKVMRASASPPILFPPVEIEGSLFADGGTRHNLLIAGLAQQIATNGRNVPSQRTRADFYVIVNHFISRKPTAVRADLRDILAATIQMNLDVSTSDSVLRAYFVTELHGQRFHMLQIPSDVDVGKDELAFDPEIMRTLYERGREMGRDPNSWQRFPPPTDEVAPWLIQQVDN